MIDIVCVHEEYIYIFIYSRLMWKFLCFRMELRRPNCYNLLNSVKGKRRQARVFIIISYHIINYHPGFHGVR